MLYDVKTPVEYLEQLDHDWRREKLESLRGLIMSKAPDLVEDVHWKMLGYGNGEDRVFHLNVQKQYVSLYVGNADKVDPDGSLLEGIDVGKGCIRFKKSTAIENTRIDEFIEKTVTLWKAGQDVDC